MTITLNAVYRLGFGAPTMLMSAPKKTKCPCGKRAMYTLMSDDGLRRLMPCCPKCGLIILEFTKRRTQDQEGAGLSEELRAWFAIDSGVSSKTIASVLVPALKFCTLDHGEDTPHDPDDFGRCYRLLKLIPGGVERLGEVSAKFPKWKRLVEHWGELTALYEEEVPNHYGDAPKLYRRMKELLGRA